MKFQKEDNTNAGLIYIHFLPFIIRDNNAKFKSHMIEFAFIVLTEQVPFSFSINIKAKMVKYFQSIKFFYIYFEDLILVRSSVGTLDMR